MRIIHNLEEMTETARGWLAGGTVGFVPTRGDLHGGHITLVQAAHQECEISVASIFVNPLQFDSDKFDSDKDRVHSPRDLERDLHILSDASVDVAFIPRAEDIFPPHFSTYVTLAGPIAERLKSVTSPRHVRGVATTIMKLFQLVRPDIAYFGQKDVQQVAIVRKLVLDLNIDMNLRILPTVRESDGVAMSSRNDVLSPVERQAAGIIYRALLAGKALIDQGERRPLVIEKAVTDLIATEPLAMLDYVSVCHPDTFLALENEVTPRTMLAIAVAIGNTRLNDNITWLGNGQWLI